VFPVEVLPSSLLIQYPFALSRLPLERIPVESAARARKYDFMSASNSLFHSRINAPNNLFLPTKIIFSRGYSREEAGLRFRLLLTITVAIPYRKRTASERVRGLYVDFARFAISAIQGLWIRGTLRPSLLQRLCNNMGNPQALPKRRTCAD